MNLFLKDRNEKVRVWILPGQFGNLGSSAVLVDLMARHQQLFWHTVGIDVDLYMARLILASTETINQANCAGIPFQQ